MGGTAMGGNSKPTPLLIRILMIGDSSVGKTSLVLRYDNRGFNLRFTTTIGVDYSDRLLELEGRQVKLQVRGSAPVIVVPNSVEQRKSVVCSKMRLVSTFVFACMAVVGFVGRRASGKATVTCSVARRGARQNDFQGSFRPQ